MTEIAGDSPDAKLGTYELLRHPRVQAFLEHLSATRHIVFVTGCARSGTSLIQRCLSTLHDPVYYWSENPLVAIWKQRRVDGANIVLKRRSACHKHFDAIPPCVKIVHIVRHPADVLTSRVRGREGYYVTPERWLAEYAAFEGLRDRHPGERLAVIRYEDLLADPDGVQIRLGETLKLSFDLPFTRYVERNHLDRKIERNTGHLRVWEPIDPQRPLKHRLSHDNTSYWSQLRPTLEPHLGRFCTEFGYHLDQGMTQEKDA